MNKKEPNIIFKCSNCGFSQPRWLGRCPQCNEWNTFEEERADANKSPNSRFQSTEKSKPITFDSIDTIKSQRYITGISEFDRMIGGGIENKSATLIGGEPGIGKSTLLLQIASSSMENFAKNKTILYITGEESAAQIKERAIRLNLNTAGLQLLCTTKIEDAIEVMNQLKPILVIIDSIQTMYSYDTGLIPGTVNQLKYCSNELIHWVKENDSAIIMTAHVTKEGTIAGPKSLEHMVDTVISFERNNEDLRFLQSLKNRFGSVDELGIFTMTDKGLIPIIDQTSLFITKRTEDLPPGVSYTPVFEGSRVFIVEIQALTIPAKASISRVYSEKIDSGRVNRIAAVLEKRCGIRFSDQDIYVNVAGGIKLTESSIDAAIAVALYSARTDIPIPSKTIIFGELSLAGEIRSVSKVKQRVNASLGLGFNNIAAAEEDKEIKYITDLKQLIKYIFSKK